MPATADYLAFIAANGYHLSEVEEHAAGLSRPKPARRPQGRTATSTSTAAAVEASAGEKPDPGVTATKAGGEDAEASAAHDTRAA